MTGNEGFSEASDRQRLWADWFAAAGADIILFAHSHCYGGFETLEASPRKTFVAWGLGNFLFGGNRGWRSRSDVRLLSIRLDMATGGKSACWLYGKTKNWQFSLYRMDESVLRQVQDLGARAAAIVGQPPVEGNEQEKADEGFGLGSLFLFWKNL